MSSQTVIQPELQYEPKLASNGTRPKQPEFESWGRYPKLAADITPSR
jgi:hypothetical protein